MIHVKPEVAEQALKISLTSFVDFLLKTSTAKVNAVEKICEQYSEEYQPSHDYYGKFRKAIQRIHGASLPMQTLDDVISQIADTNKQANYELLCKGYKRFWARCFQELDAKWIAPPKETWAYEDLNVRINPELAFHVGSDVHFVKLYFKDEKPTKQQSTLILHLMRLSLRPVCRTALISLLDVRRGSIIEPTNFDPRLTDLLEGEAACFQRIFSSVRRRRFREMNGEF